MRFTEKPSGGTNDPPEVGGRRGPEVPVRAGPRALRVLWRSPWFRWSLRLGLTVVVTWAIVSQLGVTLDEAISLEGIEADPAIPLLAIASFALLGGLLLSAVLWGRMAGELGGRDPGAGTSIRIVLTANLGRYLPGRFWPIAGLGLLARREGIPATVGVTAGLLSQSFSLAAAGVLAAPVLWRSGGTTGWAGGVVLVALALAVAVTSVPSIFRRGLGLAFRMTRIPSEQLPRTGPFFGPRWLAWYLLNWGLYGIAFVLFLHSLGLEGRSLPLVGAFTGAYLLGYVAVFAPAGLGVREGFLILFLRPELGTAAVGVAILARLWMTSVEVVPAGILAFREVLRTGGGERQRGRGDDEEEGHAGTG